MWVISNHSLAVFNPFEVHPMGSVPNACINISNVSEKFSPIENKIWHTNAVQENCTFLNNRKITL
jgi:hypothetical protein